MNKPVTLNFKNGDYLEIPGDAIYSLKILDITKNKKVTNNQLESYNTAKAAAISLKPDIVKTLKTMYMQEGIYNDNDTLGRIQYDDIISLTIDETILVPWNGGDTNSWQKSAFTKTIDNHPTLNITIIKENGDH